MIEMAVWELAVKLQTLANTSTLPPKHHHTVNLTMAHDDLRKSWVVLGSPWFLFTYKGKMSQGGKTSYFSFGQSPEDRDFETGTKQIALN